MASEIKFEVVWLDEAVLEKDAIVDWIFAYNPTAAMKLDQSTEHQVGLLAEYQYL